MPDRTEIRDCLDEDILALEQLYSDAFPDEDLWPLVRALVALESGVLSLVAVADNSLVGHGIFTMCGIDGAADQVALLGPLAVTPDWQKRGIGSQLINDGLGRLKIDGVLQVFVLGDPAYYGRFGFKPGANVQPPYPLPVEWREAWQSIDLNTGDAAHQGTLTVPQPWQRPELWGP
ncbi:MAG: N-acetyltransferase [Alphaproteobacteria bacterium]|nr:N-acetyltransferase [Alphaproteobacteria bacterium]